MIDRRADFRARFPAIRRVLLDEWDPVGVRDEPRAQDEYDGYALALYGLLARGATDDDLAEYLAEVSIFWLELGAIQRDSLSAVIRALRQVGVKGRRTTNDERGTEWPRRTTS